MTGIIAKSLGIGLMLQFFAQVLSLPCDWPSGSGKLTPHIQGTQATVIAGNETECRGQCMSESSFICSAVNYRKVNRTCELLTENTETAVVNNTPGWSYALRPICAGIWLPWRSVRSSISTPFNSSTQSRLQDCMRECLRDPSGGEECRSVAKSTTESECNLYNRTVDGTESTTGDGDIYFNRPAWYLDSARGTSNATMVQQGAEAGNWLQIFSEKTIAVSGYLVGWQYYISNSNNHCKSYVGVWRKTSGKNYKLISRTLLTPENKESGGVRFQFIQNETAPVEKGDLLSVFSSSSTFSCRSIVSSASTGGKAVGLAREASNLQQNASVTIKSFNGKRDPALRAFTSEYLKLNSAPLFTHIASLTDGQIQLTLPPPLTSEDSVIVAGYRVICSTNSTLTHAVPCYDGLVSTSTQEILLTLPDVTKQYYAAVQIVRNFNGQELIEKGISPVSNKFCPGRNRMTGVILMESNATDLKPLVHLNFSLPTSFVDDECAESIKLTYNQLYTDYRPTNTTNFTLLLDQGTRYELKIYLKLVDGGEIILWTDTYTTTAFVSTPTTTTSTTADTMCKDSVASPCSVNMAVIGGAAGGGLIAVIVFIVIAVLLSRRKNSRSLVKEDSEKIVTDGISEAETNVDLDNGSPLFNGTQPSTCSAQPALPQATLLKASGPQATITHTVPLQLKQIPVQPDDITAENTYENSTRIPIEYLHNLIVNEKDRCPKDPFKQEFLRLVSANTRCDEGRTPENIPKNRFKNITPFNENRVKLKVTDRHPSDYVNASSIKDYYKADRNKFIAAQGPKDSTAVDMWRLIHDTNAITIVMLTNLVESGKNKCYQYWPMEVSDSVEYDDYSITLVEEQKYAMYIVRKLAYTLDSKRRAVTQFHYTQWYDHGVPSPAGLLSFRSRVQQHCGSSTAPIIVHCSAGVGRTGTYIALDNLVDEAHDKRNHNKTIDIFTCVNRLRHQRTLMVQTSDQYAFLYEMVSEAVSCGHTVISTGQFGQQLKAWKCTKSEGKSEIFHQFDKLNRQSASLKGDTSVATSEVNLKKNRDVGSVPCDRNQVIVGQPEGDANGYINASHCNGYQQRDGFIVTQTPLPTTVSNYWRMVIERESPLIVYFNDCQEEVPYWPINEGDAITVGEATVSNIKTQTSGDGVTEYTLECQTFKSVRKHKVDLIEVKMKDSQELPTSKQLVAMCQKSEKFATSGDDVITVQCRNGSRLCGMFLVAMNLYLRTRIEHDIDIVLEVKLAREGRKQFISSLAQFEALYDFVEYYLSQFNEYSNFADG